MSGPRVAAIVQARMKSTRLPGKVLRPIAGQPLLWHVLHRLSKCATVDVVAVATSSDPADDAIADYCASLGVACVRGPEDDVLARYLIAVDACQADVIVRVTSDAPLIEPWFVDYLVRGLISSGGDFVMMEGDTVVAHEGADPFTRRALERLGRAAAHDPVAREHVSAYFKLHPEFVRIVRLPAPVPLQFNGARLSIDTPADAQFIEAVYDRLQAQAGEASLTDLIALLGRDPSLMDLNAHVAQKAVTQVAGTILIRCDGGGELGLGHVMRALAVAKQLRDTHGFGVRFAMRTHLAANAIVANHGFAVDHWPPGQDEAVWLDGLSTRWSSVCVIFDTRVPGGAGAVAAMRRAGRLTAVIDDSSDRRLETDLAFYPPVPQAAALEWRGARTQRVTGWDWAVLAAAPLGRRPRSANERLNVLITMGGSDPRRQTLTAARAACAVIGTHSLTVALGPDISDRTQLLKDLAHLPGPISIVQDTDDLRPLMAKADVAIATFGVTAYELAAHGVPALYLSLTPDHALSARAFVEAGLGRLIGPAGCGEAAMSEALRDLLACNATRLEMSAAGLRLVDGRGAARIAAMIAERLQADATTHQPASQRKRAIL